MKMEMLLTAKERKGSSDAAYRELAKHCKEEISLQDTLDDTDETHEIEVANVSESYDEQYENLNESYFPSGSETIALKVIDNQLSMFTFRPHSFATLIDSMFPIHFQITTFQRRRPPIWLRFRNRAIS